MPLSINDMSVERARSLVKSTETKSSSGGRMNDVTPVKKQTNQKSGPAGKSK